MTRTSRRRDVDPGAVYLELLVEARQVLEQLARELDKGQAEQERDTRNWGHVGSIGHVLRGLDGLVAHCQGREPVRR